jgi:hypothetical protein
VARDVIARAALVSFVLACASPAAAQYDVQITSRLFAGGGAEIPAQRSANAIADFGARAELLIGDAAAQRFRIGPGIDLRTATFATFEASGGVALLLPLGYDFAIEAMLGAGYAARPNGRDGGIGVLTLRAAYQPYDHFDCYSHGIAIYATGRAGLDGQTWEVTGGLEVDFEFLIATPLVYVITALSGHDPDEPSHTSTDAQ